MIPSLRQDFAPDLVAEGLARFEGTGARLLSDWHNLTFFCQRHGVDHAVRMSHSCFRRREWIQSELDWIVELSAHGIVSPRPVASRLNRFVETLPTSGSEISVVCFTALQGREIMGTDWNETFFEKWGELLGRLHWATATMQPTHPRPPWHQSDFLEVDRYLPTGDEIVRERAHVLIDRLKLLPRTMANFGLIHADIYQDNLRLLSDGRLEVFDYDNAEYGFFISDWATSLYAALWREPDPAKWDQFARQFLGALRTGYERHFQLSPADYQKIRDFLLLRDVLIYTVACKNLDLKKLNARQTELLAARRQRIVDSRSVVEIF